MGRNHDEARGRVLSPRMPRKHLRMLQGCNDRDLDELREAGVDIRRPKTRAECEGGERPCPFVSCRYHLFLDVTAAGGVKLNFPDRDVDELPASCALDVAEEGGAILDRLGELMNMTRERARQLEEIAAAHARFATPPPEAEAIAEELVDLDSRRSLDPWTFAIAYDDGVSHDAATSSDAPEEADAAPKAVVA